MFAMFAMGSGSTGSMERSTRSRPKPKLPASIDDRAVRRVEHDERFERHDLSPLHVATPAGALSVLGRKRRRARRWRRALPLSGVRGQLRAAPERAPAARLGTRAAAGVARIALGHRRRHVETARRNRTLSMNRDGLVTQRGERRSRHGHAEIQACQSRRSRWKGPSRAPPFWGCRHVIFR